MSCAIERRLQRLEQTVVPSQRVVAAFVRTGDDGRRTVTLGDTVIEQCQDEGPDAFDERARQALAVQDGDRLTLIASAGSTPDSRLIPFITSEGKVVIVPMKDPIAIPD